MTERGRFGRYKHLPRVRTAGVELELCKLLGNWTSATCQRYPFHAGQNGQTEGTKAQANSFSRSIGTTPLTALRNPCPKLEIRSKQLSIGHSNNRISADGQAIPEQAFKSKVANDWRPDSQAPTSTRLASVNVPTTGRY
uniref:Uncharacterized protein n=1 Tax=Trichuris muris TaxID=70415 RepID=A0A5S6R2V3_TRIMR